MKYVNTERGGPLMTGVSYNIQQSQNYSLVQEFKRLEESHDILHEKAGKLYQIGVKSGWEDMELMNTIAVSKESDVMKIFISYQNDKKKLIRFKLNQQHLKQGKIKKLFRIKSSRLERHLNNLTENSLGTTLNLLEEFYTNVYRDLERNTISEKDFVQAFNNMLEYEFKLEDAKKQLVDEKEHSKDLEKNDSNKFKMSFEWR